MFVVQFIPAAKVNEPYMFKLFTDELDEKFGVLAETFHVIFLQSALGTFIVTVWLVAVNDELLKVTLSFTPGTPAPPAPPDEVDHFVMSFQFPVPPTQ